MENTPLFDPVTKALLREPTPEELSRANRKADLIKTYRNSELSVESRNQAAAELRTMAAEDGSDTVWEDILIGAKKDVSPDSDPGALPSNFRLKDHLEFDPKHAKNPPAGKVKALIVTEKGEKTHFVAVNIWPGSKDIPNYDAQQFGIVIGGPAELTDEEWK